MTDEFVQYAEQRIHASTTGNAFRAWGLTDSAAATVDPIGLTFHWGDAWSAVTPGENEQPRLLTLEALSALADRNGIPLLWVGEQNVNWRAATGSVEIGEVVHAGDGTFQADLATVSVDALATELQGLLETELSNHGALKAENLTSNSFRDYTSTYLPQRYTIIDIDLFVTDGKGDPLAITEVKRTRKGPRSWTPWADDWPNYYLQIALCKAANIEPLLVHHEKGALTDDTGVGFYRDLERPVDPATGSDRGFLTYEVEYVDAREARRQLRTADPGG